MNPYCLRSLVQSVAVALAFALAGCGGGDGVSISAQQGAQMPSPSSAQVEPALCTPQASEQGTFRLVDGLCIRSSTVLSPSRAQGASAGYGAAVATDALLNWAEAHYSQYFWPPNQPTRVSSPYMYRYYPGTQNYLGIDGGNIYILGPVSGGALARVGRLDDFACAVAPQSCTIPGVPTVVAITAGDAGASIAFSPPQASGGVPITGYSATCTAPSIAPVVGNSGVSPLVVKGMRNGATYRCVLRASNQFGEGPPSTPFAVMPAASAQLKTAITLQSDPGEYIGLGRSYIYTPKNASVAIAANAGLLSVSVHGDQDWTGAFALPAGTSAFVAGRQYVGLQRYPFHDPSQGGMSWYGEGRGCNTLTGSFSVDDAVYSNGSLDAIVLSFEQHCEGSGPALRGTITWSARDASVPDGPIDPPPAGLWVPDVGTMSAAGNFAYLQSDGGDYIGAGGSYIYGGGQITTSSQGERVDVTIAGGSESWSGTFKAMDGVSPLRRGYYGDLRRYPFNNPAKGGLNWSGSGRQCNELTGWFVVDDIAYANGTLASLKLRFEQHCEGAGPALRGLLQWTR